MIEVNRYKCGYCGTCVAVCKFNAIDLVETWVDIDEQECQDCNTCVKVCPVGALEPA